jgi:hypothetical protein
MTRKIFCPHIIYLSQGMKKCGAFKDGALMKGVSPAGGWGVPRLPLASRAFSPGAGALHGGHALRHTTGITH